MSRNGSTHWCHQCNCLVNLSGRDAVCSRCGGGFIQDLDSMDGNGLVDFLGFDYEDQPSIHLVEALSAFLGSRPGRRNRDIDVRGRYPEQPLGFGLGPFVIFRGQMPAGMMNNGGMEIIFDGGSGIGLRRLPGNGGDLNPPSTGQRSGSLRNSSSSDTNLMESNVNSDNQGRRNLFSFLWPFRSGNSNSSRGSAGSSSAAYEDNARRSYSGWPFSD